MRASTVFPVFLILAGLALAGLGLAWHPGSDSGAAPPGESSPPPTTTTTTPRQPPRCQVLVDSAQRNLTIPSDADAAMIDVAISSSPPSIVYIRLVTFEAGPIPHAVGAGYCVVVFIDGSIVYNGTTALGSDGLYHAPVAVPSQYQDGRQHLVEVYVFRG